MTFNQYSGGGVAGPPGPAGPPGSGSTIALQNNGVSEGNADTLNFSSAFQVNMTGSQAEISYSGGTPSGIENYMAAYNPSNPVYGATGDGHDDYAAVNACVQAAIAANSPVVYLSKLYSISRGITIPAANFKLPMIQSASPSTDTITFNSNHNKRPGDPIMLQGAVPGGSKAGKVYYGSFESPTTTGLYLDKTLAMAGGSTGRVDLTTDVVTTGTVTAPNYNKLVVGAELNVQVGTNVLIGSTAYYVIGGVGSGTTTGLILNTNASAVVGATVTYAAWIDWRYFDGGLRIIAAPGAGLKKHSTFNTSQGNGLLNISVGANVSLEGITFEGLSSMFVPTGITGTTTGTDNLVSCNDASWARPGMAFVLGDLGITLRVRTVNYSTNVITCMATIGTAVTNGVVRGQITSGVIGQTGTGTSGTNTVTMNSINGLFANLQITFDGITGTYTISNVDYGTNVITLTTNLSGDITNALMVLASDAGDDGVRLSSVHQAKVIDCIFRHFGDSAFREQTNVIDFQASAGGNSTLGVNTGEILVKHCYFHNCYQTSTTTNDYVHGGAANVWFEGNTFDCMRGSVKFASRTLGGRNLFILNNVIKSSDNHGFEIDSDTNIKVHGNQIENVYNQGLFMLSNNGPSGAFGTGIVGFAYDGLSILNNVFENCGQGAGAASIRIGPDSYSDGTLFDYYGVVIRGNIFKNISNTAGIVVNFINGSFVNFHFEDNDFQNCNAGNLLKMTLRSSTTAGFINGFMISRNNFAANNASCTALSISGTIGTTSVQPQINEIDIINNRFSGLCTRGILLENVKNVRIKKNRMNLISASYFLANNTFGFGQISNVSFEGNDLETTATFGYSLSGISGLRILNNRHKIATGTSTASIANSCSDVVYVNNQEIGGTPNFSQVPVKTKSMGSILRADEGTAIPSAGTWLPGSTLTLTNATTGARDYVCTVGGTFGTPTGSPTATTDGSTNTVTFNSIAAITAGCFINVAGAWTGSRQVLSVDPVAKTGVVSGAVPAAVTAQAVTYVAPTFHKATTILGGRATTSNSNYAALSTDRYVGQVGTMTAAHAVTLPAASSLEPEELFWMQDESGTVTGINTFQTAPHAGDTINGSTAIRNDITTAYGAAAYRSDGVSAWYLAFKI